MLAGRKGLLIYRLLLINAMISNDYSNEDVSNDDFAKHQEHQAEDIDERRWMMRIEYELWMEDAKRFVTNM